MLRPHLPRRLRLSLPFKVVCLTTFGGVVVSFGVWVYLTFFVKQTPLVVKIADWFGMVAGGLLIAVFAEVLGAALADPYERRHDDEDDKDDDDETPRGESKIRKAR
jgi:zinc transporter ZupT